MDLKTQVIEQYKRLKDQNGGKKPLYREFLKYSGLHGRKLAELYGSDAFTKLQRECGDSPNKLNFERTPLIDILSNYGELVRNIGTTPKASDWLNAGLKPSPDAINKVQKLKWVDMPKAFLDEFGKNKEWRDVVDVVKTNTPSIALPVKSTKTFEEIVDRLSQWTPDRKRIIEEGYKIELRNYLSRFFKIDEEIGESNADLVINGKYPVEVKKDPSQSEYDRLLGQMIRHNKLYGSAIAIVTGISSMDRFLKFKRLFDEIHKKLDMRAEVINK